MYKDLLKHTTVNNRLLKTTHSNETVVTAVEELAIKTGKLTRIRNPQIAD